MSDSRVHVLLALTMLAPLLATPLAQGEADDWTLEVVGASEAPETIEMANNGETLGIAWSPFARNMGGFALRNPETGAWTVKNTDIDGPTDTATVIVDLFATGPASWSVFTNDVNQNHRFYTTTDDGTTWTPGLSLTANIGTRIDCAQAPPPSPIILCVHLASDASVVFTKSMDGGATAAFSTTVNDNDGSPSNAWTLRQTGIHSAAINAQSPTEYTVLFGNSAVFRVESGDGGQFWSVPYTSNLGTTVSPLQVNPVPGGGNPSAITLATATGATIPAWTWSNQAGTVHYELATFQQNTCASGNALVPSATVNGHLKMAGNAAGTFAWVRLCGSDPPEIWYSIAGLAFAQSYAPGVILSSLNPTDVHVTPTRTIWAYGNGGLGGRLEIRWESTPTAPEGPTASIQVDGLVGFDVDPTGATILTRQSPSIPNDIRAYNGGTLALNGMAESNCNRLHGVAAISTHVLYLHCTEANPLDVDFYHIRSNNLGAPNQPPICSDTGFCVSEISAGTLESDDDRALHLATIADFPIDYSNTADPLLATGTVAMAFAFSTLDGEVGVVTLLFRDNLMDFSNVDTAVIGGQAADQICITRDNATGNNFLYGASSQSNVKGFRVDFLYTVTGFGTRDLDVQLVEVFPGTASTAGARGVACGDGRFAILNLNKITLWQRGGAQPYQTITGLSDVPVAGITMSADGRWLAYQSAAKIHVLNTTSAQVVYTTDAVPGVFRGIELQGAGSTLWSASDSWIYRWEIYNATTGQDTIYHPPGGGSDGGSCGPGCGGSGGGGSSGGGAGGGGVAVQDCSKGGAFLKMLCETAGLTAFLAGVVLVAVGAYGAYRFTNGHPIMVLLGAGFGLTVAVGAALLDSWFIIALGAIGVAVIAGTFAKKFAGKA